MFDSAQTRTRRRVVAASLLALLAVAAPAAAKKRVVEVKVESNPPGALVSVAPAGGAFAGVFDTVAGETPLTKSFRFPKKHGLLLRFEKRGFEKLVLEVGPDASRIEADLLPVKTEIIEPAPIGVLAVVWPEIEVIRRGFSSEREDEAAAADAADAVLDAVEREVGAEIDVVFVDGEASHRPVRILWRDVRSQIDAVDPIRLPYAPGAPALENRSPREALAAVAEATGADTVLFVSGKATVETGGMKAGKIGIMAAGTASSFASGYSNAMASGSDFFTYNIYLPEFAEGLVLEALALDARTATVRWANKGFWKATEIDRPDVAEVLVADLLTGLEPARTSVNQSNEEER